MGSYNPYFAIVLCLFGFSCSIDTTMNYSGHKVIRMVPKTESQLKKLRVLRSTDNQLDFWTEPAGLDAKVDVRVVPEFLEELTNVLTEESIEFSVFIDDVKEAIDRQQNEIGSVENEYRDDSKPYIDLVKYNRIETIYQYLDSLALAYPDFVEVISIGKSYENRSLSVIKIGRNSNDSKPAIWIDAGIHAREWIAPATALFVVDQLTNHYEDHRHLVDNIDWYILSSMNPDGYEFTHVGDRFWRKTRSATPLAKCKGVDANRNFPFHFNEGGTSSFPCDEIYRGPKPLSEKETKAVADFLMEHKNTLKMYMSLHAYGQYIFTSWGYTYTLPEDYNETFDLASKANEALAAVDGSEYTVGSPTHLLYVASGGSIDYAKGVAGIKYSFGMELRDQGQYGFLLPPSEIIPTGKETFAALKYLAEAISNPKSN